MNRKDVEAIYPLTPMQKALLFHSLQSEDSDPAKLQLRCAVRGAIDPHRLERAWAHVVQRHPALRTTVHWDELDQPLQVVHRHADAAWTVEDWRDLRIDEQEQRLTAFLAADLAQPIDLSRGPAGRMALLRMEDERAHLVWTCHHVLVDGWSGALALREMLLVDESMRAGSDISLPSARPYRDYVRWLQQQDFGRAEAFWKRELANLRGATPLPVAEVRGARRAEGEEWTDMPEDGVRGEDQPFGRQDLALSRQATAALQAFAREHRLTLNTIMQSAWALVLSRHSGQEDVVFGATVSGRSVDFHGIERMVGLFINAVPVRARVSDHSTLSEFLEQVHERQAALQEFVYASPSQIQLWSGMPAHQKLYETLLVVENYPDSEGDATAALLLEDMQGGITSNHPLTVGVLPGDELTISVIYDRRRILSSEIDGLSRQIRSTLEAITDRGDGAIGDLFPKVAVPVEAGRIRRHAGRHQSSIPAPRDPLELKLVQVWESILNVHPIGLHDDFFDLGGHSLTAVELIAEIERLTKTRLPLSVLFTARTVADMARVLSRELPDMAWSSLTPIQPRGSAPPLFCIHGLAGHVFKYARLVRGLSPGQPLYAVQSCGFDGTPIPYRSVPQMATSYIAEIQKVSPTGPFLLASNCAGGMIALEMARQLEAARMPVALLAVFDPPTPDVGRFLQESVRTLRHRRMQRFIAARLLLSLGRNVPRRLRNEYIATTNKALIARYRPQPVTAPVTLFCARDAGYSGIEHAWREIAHGRLEVFEIGGPHDLLQEPYVGDLSETLQGCIDRAVEMDVHSATP